MDVTYTLHGDGLESLLANWGQRAVLVESRLQSVGQLLSKPIMLVNNKNRSDAGDVNKRRLIGRPNSQWMSRAGAIENLQLLGLSVTANPPPQSIIIFGNYYCERYRQD